MFFFFLCVFVDNQYISAPISFVVSWYNCGTVIINNPSLVKKLTAFWLKFLLLYPVCYPAWFVGNSITGQCTNHRKLKQEKPQNLGAAHSFNRLQTFLNIHSFSSPLVFYTD